MEALDQVWLRVQKKRVPFGAHRGQYCARVSEIESPSHVHASELYAAVNIVRPLSTRADLALLASRPWFVHVGDLHFRFDDSERT